MKKGSESLNKAMVLKRFKAINETAYFINELNLDQLDKDVFILFKELTSLKKRLLFILNGSKEQVEAIQLERLPKSEVKVEQAKLSILISSKEDLSLCDDDRSDIYFQLPNSFQNNIDEYLDLFRKNDKLIPWFPSVIIGDDYNTAVAFLSELKPRKIVSNNTGIAYEACQLGIDWIAGPQLNTTNSYSLLCLKEELNCSGAFISNELNRNQINQIKCPEHFELHYSIYHPLVLMTSRQCLFHQVTGCEKNRLDETCIQNCNKATSIRNLREADFFIEKSRGNYHNVYNERNFLNTAIIKDLPNKFSSYFVDLRNVKSGTNVKQNKTHLIQLFKALISDDLESAEKLQKAIVSTTCVQYKKGI